MKIAIIGYGKMGHIIERIARERGHEIVCIVDKENVADIHTVAFRSADVAIEFTTPTTAESNIRAAWTEGIPVVCGTTGWNDTLCGMQDELCAAQRTTQTAPLLFWASNFSIGVNLFFRLNKQLAELMQPYKQYKPAITEIHHIHKLDAPSGTAVTLASPLLSTYGRKTHSESETMQVSPQGETEGGLITSIREGEVLGTHIVEWDSAVDKIIITHEAKSREGFALGAVIAAEFLAKQKAAGKTGFFDMNNLLES